VNVVEEKPGHMARWEPIEEWEGAVRFAASTGRHLIAAPRGLLPHYPYLMDSLRPPRPTEQEVLGGESRLVLDVSEVFNLDRAIAYRRLYCAPWNTYLVVRRAGGDVDVMHLVGTGLRRLLLQDAVAVALAAGYDVAGWPVDVERGEWLDRWSFSHPEGEAREELPQTSDYLVLAGPRGR
jgi:hypothetical protein